MGRRKNEGGGGAPEWLVTFSDLMSLLVCFFVLLISFSVQDKQKVATVAGSMKDAFGVQPVERKAGMVEIEGNPIRNYIKTVSPITKETDSEFSEESHDQKTKQGPEANTHDIEKTNIERPRQFALAAASLRQAWAELPEVLERSDSIHVDETPQGLNIQLIDQEGRSMFEQGSATPNERARQLIAAMAPVLKKLPNRIAISGHTDASKMFDRPGYSLWDLSSDRARAARQILSENGIPHDRFHSITGKADSDPLFPDDPFLPANRRISILIMSEAPPFPAEHRP